jgi:hypothetical protein
VRIFRAIQLLSRIRFKDSSLKIGDRGALSTDVPPAAYAFSPVLADEDAVAISVAREWQRMRIRERMDWLYAYDATAIEI